MPIARHPAARPPAAGRAASGDAASGPAAPAPAVDRPSRLSPWAHGDYAVIGATLAIVAEQLVEAADVRAGEKVLDVAAGTGNAALAAARRYAHVTATDPAPALLEQARERARAEALPLSCRVAGVEALPFGDASFDIVLSTFGATYTADEAGAAREMLRVLRPGGRIGLAGWTPRGFVGRLCHAVGAHLPPVASCTSPTRWGKPAHLAALFGLPPAQLQCRWRRFDFRYRSAAHWVQVFRDFHGPLHRVFAALDPARQQALEQAITALLQAANTAGPGSLVVPASYLEAVITRPAIPSPAA